MRSRGLAKSTVKNARTTEGDRGDGQQQFWVRRTHADWVDHDSRRHRKSASAPQDSRYNFGLDASGMHRRLSCRLFSCPSVVTWGECGSARWGFRRLLDPHSVNLEFPETDASGQTDFTAASAGTR